MRQILLVAFLAVATAAAALLAVVRSHGVPVRLMDLDGNGVLSPRELRRSLDLGHRPVDLEGRPCTEILQLKDGLSRRVVCDG